jgi:hypothetical protein
MAKIQLADMKNDELLALKSDIVSELKNRVEEQRKVLSAMLREIGEVEDIGGTPGKRNRASKEEVAARVAAIGEAAKGSSKDKPRNRAELLAKSKLSEEAFNAAFNKAKKDLPLKSVGSGPANTAYYLPSKG